MKFFFLLASIAVYILTACQEKNEYTLTGTFANSEQDGKMVFLHPLDSNYIRSDAIDSIVVKDGKFTFAGIPKDMPVVQFIIMDEQIYMPAAFIAEKGKIDLSFDSELKATVRGTVMNDQYQIFETERGNIFEKLIAANKEFEEIKKAGNLTPEQFLEYTKTSKQSWEELENTFYNYIKSNITNPVGQYFFLDNSYYLNDNQLKELVSLSTPDFKNLERIKLIGKWIESREATAVGKHFTDVKGFDFDGKEIKLSDYAGKGIIVLIDFWASWCGPCIQDMPDLITTYNKYKGKGFEIVGISLDNNKENWKKTTEELKITWPQFSNLKGWEEDCSVAYGVNGIPHTVLIDKEGIIIERDLRGDALKFKLEELFGSK